MSFTEVSPPFIKVSRRRSEVGVVLASSVADQQASAGELLIITTTAVNLH